MRTRFVKSPGEVQRIQDAQAAPAFLDSRAVSTTFLTDPEVVVELLPPPLQPASEPRVFVAVYEISDSNCVGGFFGASVNLACTFQGEPGLYCLAMPMNTDTAIIFGRELYAEPKKLAAIDVEQRGQHVRGTVTRHGITYIELSVALEGEPTEIDHQAITHHYYFKHLPSADGRRLAFDPQLVRVTHTGTTRQLVRGAATLVFRESQHDPLIDIPVLEVESGAYSVGETHTRAEVVATVPADDFLPWAFAKVDDYSAWLPAPAAV
ncbi:MAG: acetoacetate decarboxylase family protein [Dehalococcoidia bacterium]|nr:acetoacetate decarboxylase family protein [Dehalococcoidia bacterium]